MNKKTRTTLFIVCFLIFILIAPLAVLYSQGYRIDLNPSEGLVKISQAGGIFLKILPRQSEIYIDGKLNKKTDFFFNSVLIGNLLPKNHEIEVKKPGYHSWKKTFNIKEKEVTEAKNIVLFPEEVNFNILSNETRNIWLSLDQKKIIAQEESESSWALKIYDLNKNVKSHLIEEKNFSNQKIELINLFFSQDSKEIYLKTSFNDSLSKKEQIKEFVLEIDKEKPVLIEKETPDSLKENIKNIVTYKIINDDIYYLNNLGHFFKNQEKISETAFPIKDESYSLDIIEGFIFLQENEALYKFNFNLKSFESFSEKIIFYKVSLDRKKLVYFSDYEISLFFLKDDIGPPERKRNENILLIRLSEPIKDVSWLNNHYLVLINNNTIKISEIDDRDKVNVIDLLKIDNLVQQANPIKIFSSLIDKKIYLLIQENEQKSLYQSDIILP